MDWKKDEPKHQCTVDLRCPPSRCTCGRGGGKFLCRVRYGSAVEIPCPNNKRLLLTFVVEPKK
jgi:hypothetical protein